MLLNYYWALFFSLYEEIASNGTHFWVYTWARDHVREYEAQPWTYRKYIPIDTKSTVKLIMGGHRTILMKKVTHQQKKHLNTKFNWKQK